MAPRMVLVALLAELSRCVTHLPDCREPFLNIRTCAVSYIVIAFNTPHNLSPFLSNLITLNFANRS